LRVQVYKDERPPAIDLDRQQAKLFLLEAWLIFRAGRSAQRAIQIICPGVVEALQRLAIAAAIGHKLGAAMTADVHKGPQLAGFIAYNDDGHCIDAEREEIARFGNLLR